MVAVMVSSAWCLSRLKQRSMRLPGRAVGRRLVGGRRGSLRGAACGLVVAFGAGESDSPVTQCLPGAGVRVGLVREHYLGPPVRITRIGSPRPSTGEWTLVLGPPRERPSHSPSTAVASTPGVQPPFPGASGMLVCPGHRGVHADNPLHVTDRVVLDGHASRSRCQVPSAVFHGPYRSGRSRHGRCAASPRSH